MSLLFLTQHLLGARTLVPNSMHFGNDVLPSSAGRRPIITTLSLVEARRRHGRRRQRDRSPLAQRGNGISQSGGERLGPLRLIPRELAWIGIQDRRHGSTTESQVKISNPGRPKEEPRRLAGGSYAARPRFIARVAFDAKIPHATADVCRVRRGTTQKMSAFPAIP